MAIIVADVFISYARIDRPFARRLADALEARGWSVWWDHRSLRGGQHFDRVIEEAIRDARVVVVVWSKASFESGWVRDEATLALEEKKLGRVCKVSSVEEVV
jgi:adenylate cyclase